MNTTTRIARASSSPSSSTFLTNWFGGSTAIKTVQIIPAAEITDWEFVNMSDAADGDEDLDVLDVLSDVEDSETKSLDTRSVSSSLNQDTESDHESDSGRVLEAVITASHMQLNQDTESELDRESDSGFGLAAVATAAHMQIHIPEAFESYRRPDETSEGEEDQEAEYSDEEDDVDLDDELVPWGLGEKFGRQRMRKLGTRACTSKKTTKKFAYTVKSRGCVSGKHGLGRKA